MWSWSWEHPAEIWPSVYLLAKVGVTAVSWKGKKCKLKSVYLLKFWPYSKREEIIAVACKIFSNPWKQSLMSKENT